MFDTRSSSAMQPLVFSILKALTPKTFQVELFDERIEPIPFEMESDLIAMTVGTFSAKRSFYIADTFRKKGISVVMGGFHPTLEPQECLKHADAVVIGDAEPNWPDLLEDFSKNQLKKIYDKPSTLNELQTSHDRSIFKNKSYLPINLVQWGRGCPHDCDFCSIKTFYPKRQILRPIQEVIDEISTLDNKAIFLVDDNLYHNKSRFIKFLKALKPLNKQWACQISLLAAKDKELIKLMSESGCIIALVGIESFDENNLKLMNKSWNNAKQDYKTSIDIFRQNGIMIYGTFIFGYDYDTLDTFESALKFAKQNKFFAFYFTPCI